MNDKVRLHIEMDRDIHHQMRVQSVKECKTLRQFVEALVMDYMQRQDQMKDVK